MNIRVCDVVFRAYLFVCRTSEMNSLLCIVGQGVNCLIKLIEEAVFIESDMVL